MKILNTKNAPAAIGPYSQAIIVNNVLYSSGQLPMLTTGELVDGNIEAQTKQVLENVIAILEEAGCTLESVVKTTVFIKDMNDFSKINDVYGTYFHTHKPARSCVEVARLPKDALIEIEVIALIK